MDKAGAPPGGAEIGLFKYPRPGSIDEIDFRLLAHLSREPFASNDMLASAVDRSASAVRKRLAALRDDGVLAGFTAYPDAALFGRVAVGAGWPAEIPLGDLLAIPDTVWAVDSADGLTGALAYTKEPNRWLAAAHEVAGVPPIQEGVLPERTLPPAGPLEWRVIRAVVRHPEGTLRELAEESGLTARTVRRVRDALLASRALTVEPLLRPSRAGALVFHANVKAPRDAWAGVQHALEECIPVSDYGESLYVFCRAPDLSTQMARLARARKVVGVERVDVVVNREMRVAEGRILEWIDDEIGKWKRRG